jgi:hypothetical protein
MIENKPVLSAAKRRRLQGQPFGEGAIMGSPLRTPTAGRRRPSRFAHSASQSIHPICGQLCGKPSVTARKCCCRLGCGQIAEKAGIENVFPINHLHCNLFVMIAEMARRAAPPQDVEFSGRDSLG